MNILYLYTLVYTNEIKYDKLAKISYFYIYLYTQVYTNKYNQYPQ